MKENGTDPDPATDSAASEPDPGRGLRSRAPWRNRAPDDGPDAAGCCKRDTDALRALAVGALAVGALSVGALAVGAVAVGRLKVGRADLGEVRIKVLRIEQLHLADDEALTGC